MCISARSPFEGSFGPADLYASPIVMGRFSLAVVSLATTLDEEFQAVLGALGSEAMSASEQSVLGAPRLLLGYPPTRWVWVPGAGYCRTNKVISHEKFRPIILRASVSPW
jgi:hypothetical protein